FAFPAGNGPDDLTLRLNGADLQIVQSATGAVRASKPLADTSAVVITGADAEDDTLQVDFAAGGFFAVPGDISFAGGTAGFDSLVVKGPPTPPGRPTASPTATGSGTVELTSGAQTSTIRFSGLEPVIVNNMPSFTFPAPTGANVVTVDTPEAGKSRISGTTGGVPFESVTFFDIQTFILDAAARDGAVPDDVTIQGTLAAHGLKNFTVNTGEGADRLTVNAKDLHLPDPTGAFTFNAGDDNDVIAATSDVTYTLTNTSLV